MLLEFGAYNFTSFKEGFQVNLREKKNSKNAHTLMGIKGANASGKTNVLKVLAFIAFFAKDSFRLENDKIIPLHSFFGNNRETNIYIIISKENDEYRYEIDLTEEEVINEKIFKNDKLIIERVGRNITNNTHSHFKELKQMLLRKNVSIISTAKQYGSNSIDEIFNLFNHFYGNVHTYGLIDEVINYQDASKIYNTFPQLLSFLEEILKKTDTGISSIEIKESINEETKEKSYFPIFNYSVDEEMNFLTYFDQSSGTKTLFKQLCTYKTVLNLGGILVLDELDINLHPDLIPILLNFFESEYLNPNNAQLIFTTHNTEIMDRLKKSRIILVNKEDNESYLYKLDETGEILRNDRSISKIYNTGRLGGKPKIELDYEK